MARKKTLDPAYVQVRKLYHIIWLQNDLVPLTHKGLYTGLLSFENEFTLECSPCQETLARRLKTSSRSISTWARELEMMDWLRIRKVPFTGGKEKNLYDLYMPQPNSVFRPLKGNSKAVHYDSPTSILLTPSMIRESGFLDYMSEA